MQEFLGDFICSDCFPGDTQFILIDACWVASEAHTSVQYDHDVQWMQRYAEYSVTGDHSSTVRSNPAKAISIPEFVRGTFDTVHSQSPGHHRKPVSATPLKYKPTWMAYDIARVCIQADRHGVGNMVLFSYQMKHNTTHYKEGAYMFSMKQEFFEMVQKELYPHINAGFEAEDPNFLTDGHPDIMKALIHVLISEGLDGDSKFRTCRLVPSMGSIIRTWPPLHSTRDYEDPHPITKSKQFTRTDMNTWKSKNTVSGLLGGCKHHEKKDPNLWSLAVSGKSKWYCSIETDLEKALYDSQFHKTYLHPRFFVSGNDGDTEGILKRVDEIPRMVYGLAIESFDPTPYQELTSFGKKKRRRNRRIQLEGRSFTAMVDKACVSLLDPFLILIGLTQEQTHSHPSNWRQRPCPPRLHDAAFVFSLHCVCVRFVCRFFRLQLVHACMHRRRHQCRGLACPFWRQDPAIVACQL